MFTGIVTGVGTLREVYTVGTQSDLRLVIAVPREAPFGDEFAAVSIGASIACSGCCLTVVEKGKDWFAADVSAETLSKTTLGSWRIGRRVNLERAVAVGQELGGHLVSGHVDDTATMIDVKPQGGSHRMSFRAPEQLNRFIAPKGSVSVDGVSLTVNEVEGALFHVNIVSHTFAKTTLGSLTPGDAVNVEIDIVARYIARLMEFQ